MRTLINRFEGSSVLYNIQNAARRENKEKKAEIGWAHLLTVNPEGLSPICIPYETQHSTYVLPIEAFMCSLSATPKAILC